MPLDPKTCPIGTKGYLPILSVYEFEGCGDESPFDYFKEPDVVLDADRQWVSGCEAGIMGKDNLVSDPPIYATWQEAVQATITSDIEAARAQISEAVSDIAQALKVQGWLDGAK